MEKTYLDSYNGFRRSVSEFGKHLIDSGLIAFGHRQSAPGVQGVINLELPLEVLQVIREAQAVAHGNGLKSCGQGIVAEPRLVSAALMTRAILNSALSVSS